MKCLGYDDKGNHFDCPNVAGTPWTHLWCHDCDERRKARITRQLEEIVESFNASNSST